MKPVILAMTMAVALSAYWIVEELQCWVFAAETELCEEE